MQACRRVFGGKISPMRAGLRVLLGRKRTYARWQARTFGEDISSMREGGYNLLGRNLTHAGEPARSFEEEISPLQTGWRAFGNDIALFERGRQDVPSFSRLLQ